MVKKNLPDCCKPKKEYHGKNVFKAVGYALIPHVGCIAFVFAAILGTTVLMQFFKPVLMNRNIFYYLILISLGFASMSSFFYLRKNKCLSWDGVKNKKGYLSIMYGSTVGVNLLLFFLIFPMLANVASAAPSDLSGLSLMQMTVDIPCPGHAPLISNEVSGVLGVEGVEYSFPNKFDVYYSGEIEGEILSLEVFDEYPANVVSGKREGSYSLYSDKSGGTCSGGCGGAGSCGGSCGSSSCALNK